MKRFSGSRGFNCSVNIPESCDFQSKFDPINMIFFPFFYPTFVGINILNEKYKTKKSVSLKIVEL